IAWKKFGVAAHASPHDSIALLGCARRAALKSRGVSGVEHERANRAANRPEVSSARLSTRPLKGRADARHRRCRSREQQTDPKAPLAEMRSAEPRTQLLPPEEPSR